MQQSWDSGKLSHAYLFAGQEGLGKKTFAVEFLKRLLGSEIFSHPDFIFIQPQEKEIQISQVRDLNWKLSLKPFSAPFKIALIDRAHLMNQEAQNCFLKTLEEPKGQALIFLITEYPELILPTIRSRAQMIKFYPVEKGEIENWLKQEKVPQKETAIISEISMGRPGAAFNFFSNAENLDDFKKRLKELTELLNSDLSQKFDYAKNLSENNEELIRVLNIWQSYFRNLLLSGLDLGRKWFLPKKEYSPEKLKDILKALQNTIFLLSTTNANPRLALEVLMLEL